MPSNGYTIKNIGPMGQYLKGCVYPLTMKKMTLQGVFELRSTGLAGEYPDQYARKVSHYY